MEYRTLIWLKLLRHLHWDVLEQVLVVSLPFQCFQFLQPFLRAKGVVYDRKLCNRIRVNLKDIVYIDNVPISQFDIPMSVGRVSQENETFVSVFLGKHRFLFLPVLHVAHEVLPTLPIITPPKFHYF